MGERERERGRVGRSGRRKREERSENEIWDRISFPVDPLGGDRSENVIFDRSSSLFLTSRQLSITSLSLNYLFS